MYPSPSSSPYFRASDADREAVVAHLSTSAAEGRLSMSEFEARTRHVYASRTWGELQRIVRDLPPLPVTPPQPPKPAAGPVWPTLALITGIGSLAGGFYLPLGLTAGLAAVVFGTLGMRTAVRGTGSQRGLAVAGFVCGVFGAILSVAMTIFLAAIGTNTP